MLGKGLYGNIRAKRKRIKAQRGRLQALGVSDEKIRHMTPKDVRDALKRPHAISEELKG